MNTSTFKDKQGIDWNIEIVVSGIDRVRKRVFNRDKKPVDLLEMTEHGDLSAITSDIRIFPTVVFWLIYEQVMERFSIEQYDADHAVEYETYPEEKRINPIQKAANWFGDRLGGDELAAMGEAFEVAILNFINPNIRDKIKRVMKKQTELNEAILERAALEAENQISAGLDALSRKPPQSLESTSEITPSDSLSICSPRKDDTTGRKLPSKRVSLPTAGSEKGKKLKSATSPTAKRKKTVRTGP